MNAVFALKRSKPEVVLIRLSLSATTGAPAVVVTWPTTWAPSERRIVTSRALSAGAAVTSTTAWTNEAWRTWTLLGPSGMPSISKWPSPSARA